MLLFPSLWDDNLIYYSIELCTCNLFTSLAEEGCQLTKAEDKKERGGFKKKGKGRAKKGRAIREPSSLIKKKSHFRKADHPCTPEKKKKSDPYSIPESGHPRFYVKSSLQKGRNICTKGDGMSNEKYLQFQENGNRPLPSLHAITKRSDK